jgi:multidrug efflux pump subunit AcrA (membrane-fusion protein)
MKKRGKGFLIAVCALVAVGGGVWILRGTIFPSSGTKTTTAAAVSTVKVTRGDIQSTVSASGQLQPSTSVTIRPDSNMPARKIVSILVSAGQTVAANQPLAEIDPTGLDLSLKSAEANYQAQLAKLEYLKARPVDMDLVAAEAALAEAQATLDAQTEGYDSTKALADKGLASRNALSEKERALNTAKAAYEAARLSLANVKAQSATADMQAQEAAVATADYNRQIAKIVLDSVVIRSPHAGTVAEVLVSAGDIVNTNTAVAYVVVSDPMLLVAAVNENDMPSVRVGQSVTVTQAAYPNIEFTGRVKSLDLKATTNSNVSTFAATIEIPNRDGKLLWGMNADAEIAVVSLKNVLTLPSTAVKTSNGASTVTLLDGGKAVTWDVQIGATDGSRTQILAGLDEGTEVVTSKKSTSASTTAGTQSVQGNPGPGGPPDGGLGGIIGGMMR